jgi:hypothetical protein
MEKQNKHCHGVFRLLEWPGDIRDLSFRPQGFHSAPVSLSHSNFPLHQSWPSRISGGKRPTWGSGAEAPEKFQELKLQLPKFGLRNTGIWTWIAIFSFTEPYAQIWHMNTLAILGCDFGNDTIQNNLVSSRMDAHMHAWSRPPLARQAIAMSGQGVLEISRARFLYLSAALAKFKIYASGVENCATTMSDRYNSTGLRYQLNLNWLSTSAGRSQGGKHLPPIL